MKPIFWIFRTVFVAFLAMLAFLFALPGLVMQIANEVRSWDDLRDLFGHSGRED